MKSTHRITCLAGALAALSIGTANAGLVTLTDTYTPASPVFLNSSNTSYSFTHSILPQGFNSATDTIVSAMLQLFFRDDFGPGDGAEKVNIYIDQQQIASGVEANATFTYALTAPFDNLADGLLDASLLNVRIGGTNTQIGDFFFDGSSLSVTVERAGQQAALASINAVPEPASLALAGLALAGLAAGRRQRKSQSD